MKYINDLKPVKGIEKWAHDQFSRVIIFYKRHGVYATCHCSECGGYYQIRTRTTGDPFEDDLANIEKPIRDEETKCRLCKRDAIFKPAGCFKGEWRECNIVTGQKIDDNRFVFRVFYATQKIYKDCRTAYSCNEYKRIFTESRKKPVRYYNQCGHWMKTSTGDNYQYLVHPSTFKEIKKTGMYKYVPYCKEVAEQYYGESWVMDYYIAAARYPDMEMIVKTGMIYLASALVAKNPVNFNPRGREIHNRLRIQKERVPYLVKEQGNNMLMRLFQFEKKTDRHWTDEELEIVKELFKHIYTDIFTELIRYINPVRMKNYMSKCGIWYDEERMSYSQANKIRREYFDYLKMRADAGYDLTNDIIMYPNDIVRRHAEMVIESEKKELDKRMKNVINRFPWISRDYRKLSEKYSAAAAGYIIRPAKDAAEIVMEGRLLHHCVGASDTYMKRHNKGESFILFLRKASEPDIPFITVEIEGESIIQWYGAYDKKPEESFFDAWLKTYTGELVKRKEEKKDKKAAKTA